MRSAKTTDFRVLRSNHCNEYRRINQAGLQVPMLREQAMEVCLCLLDPVESAQQARGPPPGIAQSNGGPYLHAQASTLTQNSGSSQRAANNPGGAMKIKVFFQDDTIVIRVPQDVTFTALKDKLVERLKVNEDIAVQYKDEPTNSYIDMENDDNLDVALQRNPKLTLYVNYAAG